MLHAERLIQETWRVLATAPTAWIPAAADLQGALRIEGHACILIKAAGESGLLAGDVPGHSLLSGAAECQYLKEFAKTLGQRRVESYQYTAQESQAVSPAHAAAQRFVKGWRSCSGLSTRHCHLQPRRPSNLRSPVLVAKYRLFKRTVNMDRRGCKDRSCSCILS